MQTNRIILGAVAGLMVLAGAGYALSAAMRQPDAADFRRFDSQRQAVDASMNVYVPLFSAYTTDYAFSFNEDRPVEEQMATKERYAETFEREHEVNEDRLTAMKSSVATKNESVKTAFADYQKAYQAVIDYNEGYERAVTNVTESLAGKCDLNSELNVASPTLGEDYTKAADACLAALKAAKEGTDETTTKLLTSVEKVVTERRDAFKKTIGTDGVIASATKLGALVTLLTINGEIKPIQDDYERSVKEEYNRLATKANATNEALKKALEPLLKESAEAQS